MNKATGLFLSVLSIASFILFPALAHAEEKPKIPNVVWPTQSVSITQPFSDQHTGMDIRGKIGDPVFSVTDGKVVRASKGYNGGYGNTAVIETADGLRFRYGQLNTLKVKTGQKVLRGQKIGTLGSSGRSTGPHLHFEFLESDKRIDPMSLYQ